MKTRLILCQDIPSLGHVGDVIEVATGYARNFLIPRGHALAHSEDGMRRIEKARLEAQEMRARQAQEHEAVATRLGSLQLTFEEKVSADGHLYGAVTAKRISEALVEHGFEMPESQVRLAEPIRGVGEFEVPIHIHGDLSTMIKVWVVAQVVEQPEEPEEAEA